LDEKDLTLAKAAVEKLRAEDAKGAKMSILGARENFISDQLDERKDLL